VPLDRDVYRCMMQPGLDLPSLADVIGRPEWMDRGACREESTAKFFPAVGGSAKVMAEARALCASCPVLRTGCSVRPESLSYALADSELVGFWAGTAVHERRSMRRVAADEVA
jgi:hypothetical protein